jgi:hypothetical protein
LSLTTNESLFLGIRTVPSKGEFAIEMLQEMYVEGTIDLEEFEIRVAYALDERKREHG